MKYIAVLFAVLLLYGCAASPQLPLQYATLRLLEKGDVQAETILERTNDIRQIMSQDGITLSMLDTRVKSMLGYDEMMPSNRLIVDAMMADVTYGLDVDISSPLDESTQLWINERLGWIDAAAAMY